MKLNSIYVEYFPEYANYFGRPLRLKKSMYGITKCGELFSERTHLSYDLGIRSSSSAYDLVGIIIS